MTGSARAIALLLWLPACERARPSNWSKVAESQVSASNPRLPVLVTDATLKTFLPERLGARLGASPQGTMTRMGNRALSEATRSYRANPASASGEVELKIADAWLEPRATQAIRSLADAEHMLGGRSDGPFTMPERLVLPGAVGYARLDEEARQAQAQILIGGRFIASATVAQAEDAQEAAQALRALDTLGLARLAQTQ
jgi:hypothetical protein